MNLIWAAGILFLAFAISVVHISSETVFTVSA